MKRSQDLPETGVEPFHIVQERAVDSDPAVRLTGIEATGQTDEDTFGLLAATARADQEADNRLSAVSQLEQMLKTGRGDREQILRLLQETAADPDSRVAELSQLVIQEQPN